MRRRWVRAFIGLIVVLALVVALAPWWFGAALRGGAGRFGTSFSQYETLGYRRFALHDVRVQRDGVLVRIERIEAETPLVWLWQHARHAPSRLVAGRWSVEVQKRKTPPPPTPSGWMPLRAKLWRIANQLNRWASEAEIGPGTVRWATGEITTKAAEWHAGTLRIQGLGYRTLVADVSATFAANDTIKISGTSAAADAALDLESREAVVRGDAKWWGQRAAVDAHFAAEGWMPPEASIQADELALPGDRVKLGTAYAVVRGHGRIDWQRQRFVADVALHGEPVSGKAVPPLDVALRGHGDPRAFTVETVHAVLPGATADLTAPFTVDRSGKIEESAARFSVQADLAQQPWIPAKGEITGEARVVSDIVHVPVIDFALKGSGIAARDVSIRGFEANGQFNWPELRIAQASLVSPSGDELRARGGWNFRDKQVLDVSVSGALRRESVARWLPATVQFERIAVDAHATGSLAELQHGGRVEASGFRYGKLKPASASLTWRAVGVNVEMFAIEAAMDPFKVAASGTANLSEVRLSELTMFDHGVVALRLKQPARIAWRPTLLVENVQLAGADAAIDATIEWAPTGRVEVALRGFRSDWITDVVPLPGPRWIIPSAALKGTWDRSPMTYSLAGGVSIDLGENRTASINLAAHGQPEGLWIDGLRGVESGNPVVNATGRLPVAFSPSQQRLVAIDPQGDLLLDASTVPNAAFWQQLAALTGVELRDPQMQAHLSGSWAKPRGTVTFRAARAAMDPKRFARPLPSVEAVDIAVAGDTDGIRFDRFSFAVERQLVRVSGRLPVAENAWTSLAHAPIEFLRRDAELRVEVPDAEVAMFSRFLPAALAPAGRLQADIQYRRGALGGFLRLRDAASRPLGPLGVLQQVNAEVEFSDRRVDLRRVTATTGGEPVTVTGSVELPAGAMLSTAATAGEPRYDIAVQGKNLPFVRQSGLLVRGDLDLKLKSPPKGPPHISGKVVLRDSLFLADVRAFLPHGAGANPSRRPPYFSVDTPPLNTWVLDVDVSGTRFIRLRTPVFSGTASAHFHLGGTLGEPRAVGEANVDEGRVLMPFAAFDVRQGSVRLTEENPYEPTIFLRGVARHYGYDLTMEINGKASSPDIEFTSSPALDSEQVLLMVMTGAAPSNDVNTSVTHRAVQIGRFFSQTLIGTLTGDTGGEDRLTIESGEKISRQGKETYQIDYKLSDRWTITGEYDEFDEYNAGFKWRVAPKKKQP